MPCVGWVCCWFSPLLQEINFSPVTCTPVFLSPKSIIFKFQFDQERQTKNHSVDENPKCAKTAEKVVNSAVRVKEKTFWLTYSCICYRSNGALLKMAVKGILWYLFALLFAYMLKNCPVICRLFMFLWTRQQGYQSNAPNQVCTQWLSCQGSSKNTSKGKL